MKRLERAISIRQPYVELIMQGKKKYEYRSMPTNIRERVYVYASLRIAESDSDWKKLNKPQDSLTYGAIVGSVEIVGCEFDSRRDCYAYKLAKPKRLATPIKATNQPAPRFWRPIFK